MRKWYGAPDLLSKDGDLEVEDDSSGNTTMMGIRHTCLSFKEFWWFHFAFFPCWRTEIEEVRDAVLVTDGESEIGQVGKLTSNWIIISASLWWFISPSLWLKEMLLTLTKNKKNLKFLILISFLLEILRLLSLLFDSMSNYFTIPITIQLP